MRVSSTAGRAQHGWSDRARLLGQARRANEVGVWTPDDPLLPAEGAPSPPRGVLLLLHEGHDGAPAGDAQLAGALRALGWLPHAVDVLSLARDEHRGATTAEHLALLARELDAAVARLSSMAEAAALPLAVLATGGASAVALRALAARPAGVAALVSIGGRVDLVPGAELARIGVPTLLVVGGYDGALLELTRLTCPALPQAELRVVRGADRRFADPPAREELVRLVDGWLRRHARRAGTGSAEAAPRRAGRGADAIGSPRRWDGPLATSHDRDRRTSVA